MNISINADSVEELKYLAGLLNSKNSELSEPPVVVEPEQEPEMTSPCSQTSDSGSMNDILAKLRNIQGVDSATVVGEEDLDEWANSTEQFDGEPRELEQPKGGIVDTSLRRYLGAKGNHVTVDEALHDAIVQEGFKDKLKILALLGLAGMGANYTLDKLNPVNTPLGQALQQAADQGDEDAAYHLRNLGAYIDVNSPELRMLNHQYLNEESHTIESITESYNKFKK